MWKNADERKFLQFPHCLLVIISTYLISQVKKRNHVNQLFAIIKPSHKMLIFILRFGLILNQKLSNISAKMGQFRQQFFQIGCGIGHASLFRFFVQIWGQILPISCSFRAQFIQGDEFWIGIQILKSWNQFFIWNSLK